MAMLAQLLADPSLGLVPVVDGRRREPVRWVATSELDDPAPFLEGGEVLLTTGLETAGWTTEWDAYVARLASAGVVAIGLAVDLTHDRSPAPLVAACRDHGVDLFEVPRATRFVAISRALAAQLQAEEEAAIRAALGAQRALTQAALREDRPDAVLDELARTAAMVALVDPAGLPLAGPRGPRPEMYDAGQVSEVLAEMRPRGFRAAAGLSTPEGTLVVQPVGATGRPDRYLVAGIAGPASEAQRSTVSVAVALLSLAEERRRGRRAAERRLRSRALELLVGGDEPTARVLLETGAGTLLRWPRTVTVVRAEGADLEEGLDQVEEGAILAGALPEGLVAVMRADHAGELADALAEAGLRVGVGEPGPPDAVPRSHETAGHALRVTTPDAPVATWAESVTGGVLALVDADRARAFAESWLAPLVQDAGTDLVGTLDSFLRHHGSLLKVAEDLGVHRNTVRNRVERIETVLGRSLQDPQLRVDAWVALRALVQTS